MKPEKPKTEQMPIHGIYLDQGQFLVKFADPEMLARYRTDRAPERCVVCGESPDGYAEAPSLNPPRKDKGISRNYLHVAESKICIFPKLGGEKLIIHLMSTNSYE